MMVSRKQLKVQGKMERMLQKRLLPCRKINQEIKIYRICYSNDIWLRGYEMRYETELSNKYSDGRFL